MSTLVGTVMSGRTLTAECATAHNAGEPWPSAAYTAEYALYSDSNADPLQRGAVLPDPSGTPTINSPNARAIFTAIKDALEIPDTPAADTFSPQARDLTKQVHKYLTSLSPGVSR